MERKIIEFKIRGHVLRLTNAEWKNLKERFDPNRAFLEGGKFHVKIPCKLCIKHRILFQSCGRCPFDIFGTATNNGCIILIAKLFPSQSFWIRQSKVYWGKVDDHAARRQLYSIQKRMKRIEESQ